MDDYDKTSMTEPLTHYAERQGIKKTGTKEEFLNQVLDVLLKDIHNQNYGGKRQVIIDCAKQINGALMSNKIQNAFPLLKKFTLALNHTSGDCLYATPAIAAIMNLENKAMKEVKLEEIEAHLFKLKSPITTIYSIEMIKAKPRLLEVMESGFQHMAKHVRDNIIFILKEHSKKESQELMETIRKFSERQEFKAKEIFARIANIEKTELNKSALNFTFEQRKKYYEQHPEKNPRNRRRKRR
ncbi:MAG: hypothetical protein JW703_02570 [Candidatus Diapherotrites archaeon]|nr:hypothetical protein [Candidatus Diapherotrites archaeon]